MGRGFKFENRAGISEAWPGSICMLDLVAKLKTGKSYVGLVKAEHILYGSPSLLIHLHILFNAMLQHGFIPTLLLRGSISPLVNDRDGELSDSSNYRAVSCPTEACWHHLQQVLWLCSRAQRPQG